MPLAVQAFQQLQLHNSVSIPSNILKQTLQAHLNLRLCTSRSRAAQAAMTRVRAVLLVTLLASVLATNATSSSTGGSNSGSSGSHSNESTGGGSALSSSTGSAAPAACNNYAAMLAVQIATSRCSAHSGFVRVQNACGCAVGPDPTQCMAQSCSTNATLASLCYSAWRDFDAATCLGKGPFSSKLAMTPRC